MNLIKYWREYHDGDANFEAYELHFNSSFALFFFEIFSGLFLKQLAELLCRALLSSWAVRNQVWRRFEGVFDGTALLPERDRGRERLFFPKKHGAYSAVFP